jgi:hypothetical protein
MVTWPIYQLYLSNPVARITQRTESKFTTNNNYYKTCPYLIILKLYFEQYFTPGIFFQDLGNMTHTHGNGNFSNVLIKNWEKMHDLNFAVIK